MNYKTIMTIISNAALYRPALDTARCLSERFDAHLEALCLGVDPSQQGFYYAGATAMMMQDNMAQVRTDTEVLEGEVRQILASSLLPWSTTALATQSITLNHVVSHRCRFADLVVLPRPYGEGRGHDSEAIIESAMFDGNAPVLVLPDDTALTECPGNVVIAWNESPEALRAVRAALPFLKAAESISIAIIDPPQHGPERSDPGGALGQMLARHGVRAEVSVLARTMPRVADILNRHASDKNADLIVMGGYGHSRFRESILGGATRHMLEISDVPVLMAH